MKNQITINFKNIVLELENKKLNLCFLRNRGIFLEDTQGNLFQMETYRQGSYFDKLIKDGIKVNFNLVGVELSKNIRDWEKEIWAISEIETFIKRHSLLIAK